MKFKILLFAFAALLVTFNTKAQDFWEVLPFPDSTDIYCTAVNNEGDIFVGAAYDGAPGGVYRSLDNGQTWNLVMDLGIFSVLTLEISNDGTIYAGSNGLYPLHASTDNGDNWTIIPMPQILNVVKIESKGSDTLYVSQSRSNGALLMRSTDGGQTWATVFTTSDHSSECINDIVITPSGTMYIGLAGYLPGMGGVYISSDNGDTWEFIGLYDCMVTSLAVNNAGDLFAGSWGGTSLYNAGIYVLRNGHQDWDTLTGGQISDMVINSEGHIYCSSAWPDGVIRSLDNGASFQLINSGIPSSPMGDLAIDNLGYIYVTAHYRSNFLAKSVGPTVSVPEPDMEAVGDLLIYPNPATERLTGRLIRQSKCNGRYRLSILSMSSQAVMETEIPVVSGKFTVPVAALPTGLYVVRLTDNTETFQARFVKR